MLSQCLDIILLLSLYRQVLCWPVDGLQQPLGRVGADGDTDLLKTCLQCPPGTFASKPCYSGSQTLCEACPPSTFSDTFNLQASCRPCSRCKLGHLKGAGCTPTTDTVCTARIHRRSEDTPPSIHIQPDTVEDQTPSAADHDVTHTEQSDADEGEKNGDAQERDAIEGEHDVTKEGHDAREGKPDPTEGEHDATESEHDAGTKNKVNDSETKNKTKNDDPKEDGDGETKSGANDVDSTEDDVETKGVTDDNTSEVKQDGDVKRESSDDDVTKRSDGGDEKDEVKVDKNIDGTSDGDTQDGASDRDTKNGDSDGDTKNGATDEDNKNGASDGDTKNGASDEDNKNGASDDDTSNKTPSSDNVGDLLKTVGQETSIVPISAEDGTALTDTHLPAEENAPEKEDTAALPKAESHPGTSDQQDGVDYGMTATLSLKETEADSQQGDGSHSHYHHNQTTKVDSPNTLDVDKTLQQEDAETFPSPASAHSTVTPMGQAASPREDVQHDEEKKVENKAEEELQEIIETMATTDSRAVNTEAVDVTGTTEGAHKGDSVSQTGSDVSEYEEDEKHNDNTEDALEGVQNKEQSKVTEGMSGVDTSNKPSAFTELQNMHINKTHDLLTPSAISDTAPEGGAQDASTDDSKIKNNTFTSDMQEFQSDGIKGGDDVATTPQTELQGNTTGHTQDIVNSDLTLAQQEMAEGLMESKGHTENWQQNVTMARGSIPGAVLWRSYAPSSMDSGVNVTDKDSATSLSLDSGTKLPHVVTPVIPVLDGQESTNITSDDNQFGDGVNVANSSADVTGADGGVIASGHGQSTEVNSTEHSTTVLFIADTLLSTDEEEVKGEEGKGEEQPGTTVAATEDQGLHAGIDTKASDSGIPLAVDASTDPATGTQQPESISTDDVLNNTDIGSHSENDLVIISPVESLPEQTVIHGDGEMGHTTLPSAMPSDHLDNKSDINLSSNATENSSDENVTDTTNEPFIHEGVDLSTNVTHVDEIGPEGQHHINIVHSTTHTTTQRIPTIEEFESTLEPEGEHNLELGSGDTGFTLDLDPASNDSHVDHQHKGEEDKGTDKVDGPTDDATTGSETEEATRKPPGRPGDNVKAGHVIPWDTNHLFTTATEEKDGITDNDSNAISGPAKQGGDTEDDASSKQRTAIIVGVAIGGVALFALGFFASRKCKRRGEFKPAPREDGEANGADEIEFRPLKGGSSGASGVYDEVMEGVHPTQQKGRFSYRQVGSEGYSPVATSEPTSPAPGHPPMESFAAPVEDDTYAVVNKQLKSNPSADVKPEPGISEIDKIRYIDETTDDEGADSTPHDRLLPPKQRHHAALPEVETEEDEEGIAPPPLPALKPPSVSPKSTSLGKEDTGLAQPKSASSDSMASLGNDVMQKLDLKMTNGTKKRKSQRSLEGYGEAEGSGADDQSKVGSIVNGDRAPIIMRNGV